MCQYPALYWFAHLFSPIFFSTSIVRFQQTPIDKSGYDFIHSFARLSKPKLIKWFASQNANTFSMRLKICNYEQCIFLPSRTSISSSIVVFMRTSPRTPSVSSISCQLFTFDRVVRPSYFQFLPSTSQI